MEGAGFTSVDPNNEAGGYTIEGGANGGVFLAALIGVVGWFFLSSGIGFPIIAALMISFALHLALICLIDLASEGLFELNDVFLGSAAALSLIRALATLFAGTALAFPVPGGVLVGGVLVVLAILGFYRIGK